jgi:hypothetical protein
MVGRVQASGPNHREAKLHSGRVHQSVDRLSGKIVHRKDDLSSGKRV